MPTTFMVCLPVAANSVPIVSPTFHLCEVAADFATMIPLVPRFDTEPADSRRFSPAVAVAGSTEEELESAPSNRACPQPLAETLSTPDTPWTTLIASGL